MLKLFSISLLGMFFLSAAVAQEKKYVYQDSALNADTSLNVAAPSEDNSFEKPTEEAHDTIYVDTTLYLHPHHASADSIAIWKNLEPFAYAKYLDSLLKDKQNNIKPPEQNEETHYPKTDLSWLGRLFSSSGIQFFFWALAIFFVLFIVYKLFLTQGVFSKKTTSLHNTLPQVEEENVHSNSNFIALINQAVQAGNYRLAVRYQYLQLLQKLANKNLIELAVDKTNFQYLNELSNKNYRQDFASLTVNYEYVWYGEFGIDDTIYKKLENNFTQFNSKI